MPVYLPEQRSHDFNYFKSFTEAIVFNSANVHEFVTEQQLY